MKGSRSLFIVVGIIAILILGWWLYGRRGSEAVTLTDPFDAAQKKPAPETFKVEDVTINGETKKSIAVTRRAWAAASSSRRGFLTMAGCASRWR